MGGTKFGGVDIFKFSGVAAGVHCWDGLKDFCSVKTGNVSSIWDCIRAFLLRVATEAAIAHIAKKTRINGKVFWLSNSELSSDCGDESDDCRRDWDEGCEPERGVSRFSSYPGDTSTVFLS